MVRKLSVILLVGLLCGFQGHLFAESPDDSSIESTASKILSNVLKGLSEGDYTLYAGNFSGILKESLDRESFLKLQKNIQKSLGKSKGWNYLGYYRQYGNIIALFKAKFSKDRDDVLIKLVLDDAGTDAGVNGLWFDSPALEK